MRKIWISLLFPFLIWLFVNQGIFTKNFLLGEDNLQYYHWILYYVEHLARGVYPLWNPFHAWGSADNFDMLFMGPFNPIFGLMAILVFLKVNAYGVFVGVILAYLALGYLGGYCLARRIIGGHWWAWLVYVLFLFSGFGTVIFKQLVVLFMFVPLVWFFFFLISFTQAQEKRNRSIYGLGASLALAISLNSYVPVFFIFIFSVFLCVCLVIRFSCLIQGIKSIGTWIIQAPWLALICTLGILLSLLPDVLWYVQSKPSEYVLMIWRGNDKTGANVAEVSLDAAKRSSIATFGSWEELFTDFEGVRNHYIFVPVLAFLLVLMSLLNKVSAWQGIVFFTGFIIFLFGMTDATPLYGFLVKHIYILNLFRNYFFFIPFIVFLSLLFLVGQLKALITQEISSQARRIGLTLFIILTHGSFYYFLSTLYMVPVLSFVTIVLSSLWFLGWVWGIFKNSQTWFLLGLGLMAMLQPLYVLSCFGLDCSIPASSRLHPIQDLKFSFLRPLWGQGRNEENGFHKRNKQSVDESGFSKVCYMGTRWSYDVHSQYPPQLLTEYVRHKLIAYDCTAYMDPVNWALLEPTFYEKNNLAYVVDQDQVKCLEKGHSQSQILEPQTNLLRVNQFNVNRLAIKTNFPSKKFLVYNDSFHPQWRVWMDGKPVSLTRANAAFKGLWVDAGEHQIVFQYGPLWLSWIFMGAMVLYFSWFIVSVFLFIKIQRYVYND